MIIALVRCFVFTLKYYYLLFQYIYSKALVNIIQVNNNSFHYNFFVLKYIYI